MAWTIIAWTHSVAAGYGGWCLFGWPGAAIVAATWAGLHIHQLLEDWDS